MDALLHVDRLSKRFAADQPPVVRELSFAVQPGEIFVLLGPSGCGKTTTLRIISGFERADAGEVRFDGRVIEGPRKALPPEKRGIGFVFQDYALFPHRSVIRNVMYGLGRLPRRQRRQRALQALETVGMAELAERRPHELSGGQQQRVALARSLAPSPKLLLLDEPFSNLDPALRANTRAEIRKLLHEAGMTAVLVTHDQEEALSFADRIAVMDKGTIAQAGDPRSVYCQPCSCFVAKFLGDTNLIWVEAQGDQACSPLGPMRLNRCARGRVMVSLRPEQLDLSTPTAGRPEATVLAREFKGHDLTYTVGCQGQSYTVQTDHRCPFAPGAQVCLIPREQAVVLGCNNPERLIEAPAGR